MEVDRVWMLVRNDKEVIYIVGASAKDVWQRVIESEVMGTGVGIGVLVDQGWRAKQVSIVLQNRLEKLIGDLRAEVRWKEQVIDAIDKKACNEPCEVTDDPPF